MDSVPNDRPTRLKVVIVPLDDPEESYRRRLLAFEYVLERALARRASSDDNDAEAES